MDDLYIIPDHIQVPADFPYQYHKIKHLHTPSIVQGLHYMNTQMHSERSTIGFIKNLLGMMEKEETKVEADHEVGQDIFFRHIRVMNRKNGEFYHNRGATVLVDLRASEGRFFFSYSMCNHRDNFNKTFAHTLCRDRMDRGEVVEVINYDPNISIIQNIFLAIGVQENDYSLTDYDWTYIIPELYGVFNREQKDSLSRLRKLIRNKAQ